MPRRRATAIAHPAPFSTEVVDVMRRLLVEGERVHDCYAGTGERLGVLADELGLIFTGTDLEPEFISDPRVVFGNACDAHRYPLPGFTVATSPVYPNGIADHFNAQDSSRRRTYRSALAKLLGFDRPLHVDNQGRWGYRGTPLHSTARGMYWSITGRTIDAWNEAGAVRALVNVSDFTWAKGARYEPVVDGWANALMSRGWRIVAAHKIDTPRYGFGANREHRAEYEVVLEAVRL